jgi:hypothetical protein
MTAPQNVDFETPELSEGIHDIVVAVTTHTDVPRAFNTSFERGLRISIVAGKPRLRDLSFQRLEATAVPPDAEIHRRLGLTLPNQTRYWIEEEPVTLSSGELLSFDILRRYVSHRINSEAPDLPQPALDRFAIIAFIAGEPVPLDDDFTLYAEVTADTLAARIPVQVPQPLPAGEHELVVISIPHPGIPMCQLFGPPNGYFFASQPEYTWARFHITE